MADHEIHVSLLLMQRHMLFDTCGQLLKQTACVAAYSTGYSQIQASETNLLGRPRKNPTPFASGTD